MSLKLTIKWGKKKVENVTLDVQSDVATFKATIYSLTGVPTNRQKLLCRKSWKGQLKDEMKFSEMKNVNEKMKIIILYTGLTRELTTSGFNSRVEACKKTAAILGLMGGLKSPKMLSDIPQDVYFVQQKRLPKELQPCVYCCHCCSCCGH